MRNWIMFEKEFNIKNMANYESVMCQGNGYMGIRNAHEEKYVSSNRVALVNGVFDTPEGETAELAVLPDVTNFDIYVNGYDFSMITGELNDYCRELNLKTAESVRKVLWTSPDGKKVRFEFRKFVSDVKKHIFAQKITISALDDIELSCISGIDGKITNSGVSHFGVTVLKHYGEGVIGLSAETLQSKVQVCVCTSVKCDKTNDFELKTERRGIYDKFKFSLKKGETVCFEKISSYATGRDFEYAEKEPESITNDCYIYLKEAMEMGYDHLAEENAASWKKFWDEKRISIESDNDLYQNALNFAMYHLKIMANGNDSRLGVGAKALSGEGYKGHSFWDTEIFILPFYIFNEPNTARKLLEYRYNLLEVACEKAKKYGYSGAMYPWECAWIDDGEVCPEFGDIDVETGEQRAMPMGSEEIHITADIVYGIWMYYMATDDVDFMEKYGYEIVILSALFWASRAVERNGRYEILKVIGPDEYKEGVNNNAYTNYMAHFNMELALKYIDVLSEETKQRIEKKYSIVTIKEKILEVKDKLYLPVADENGIIPQFDGFSNLKPIDITDYKETFDIFQILSDYPFEEINNMQVCKQADNVMLFYTLKDKFKKEEIEKNFEYYEERTLHDSSLSMCMHSVVASYIGNKQMAEKLYRDCCVVDYGEENNNSKTGIHSASIGGIWIAAVMGFCGVRADEEGLHISKNLPDGIKRIQFPIIYKNSGYELKISSDNCEIKRISGLPQSIIINEEKQIL